MSSICWGGGRVLTDEDVQEIVRLLDELPFDEMHLTTRHLALSLRRTGDGWSRSTAASSVADNTPAPPPERDVAGRTEVRAHLPGTFYRAPKPGAPPFVEVGSPVRPDTVVGIVETMKLMNSVLAGTHGQVAEIWLADGQFAEQDAILMLIELGS
jgi:acetyl-CoA carboxylase biotin carboxyl carrier protein